MTKQPVEYDLQMHQHRFAAWAASRAASVSTCRFRVEQGREVLEKAGFDASFTVDALPASEFVDAEHARWRRRIIAAALGHHLTFTHGVAAKLINVYVKSRFVCGGHHDDPCVRALHPPVDAVLLKQLAKEDVGGQRKVWKAAAATRWSRFASKDYERVIQGIQKAQKGAPLWMIEAHWKGNI